MKKHTHTQTQRSAALKAHISCSHLSLFLSSLSIINAANPIKWLCIGRWPRRNGGRTRVGPEQRVERRRRWRRGWWQQQRRRRRRWRRGRGRRWLPRLSALAGLVAGRAAARASGAPAPPAPPALRHIAGQSAAGGESDESRCALALIIYILFASKVCCRGAANYIWVSITMLIYIYNIYIRATYYARELSGGKSLGCLRGVLIFCWLRFVYLSGFSAPLFLFLWFLFF